MQIDLKQFIENFRQCQVLSKNDLALLERFEVLYSQNKLEDNAFFLEIESLITHRSSYVQDTLFQDYTFTDTPLNQLFIQLAIKVGEKLGKDFRSMLVPTIQNPNTDPHSLRKILHPQAAKPFTLANFFIGYRNTAFYHIENIEKQLSESGKELSIYASENKPRALTIIEMYRIRSKVGLENTPTLYDKIQKKIARKNEERAIHVKAAQALLDLLSIYFKQMSESTKICLNEALDVFQNTLLKLSAADVNYLYAQKIQVKGSTLYLLDLFIDCYALEAILCLDNMKAIAGWLATQDYSLVYPCDALRSTYKSVGIFDKNDAQALKAWIQKLFQGCDPQLNECLARIQSEIRETIDPLLIAQIRALYQLRWRLIEQSSASYLTTKEAGNKPWVQLAQILKNAGCFSEAVDEFLMPKQQFALNTELRTNAPNIKKTTNNILIPENEELNSKTVLMVKQFVDNFFACSNNAEIHEKITEYIQTEKELEMYLDQFYGQPEKKSQREAIGKDLKEKLRRTKSARGIYVVGESSYPVSASLRAYCIFMEQFMNLKQADPAEWTRLNNRYVSIVTLDLKHEEVKRVAVFHEVIDLIQQPNMDEEPDACLRTNIKFFIQLVMDYFPFDILQISEYEQEFLKRCQKFSSRNIPAEYQQVYNAADRMRDMFISLLESGQAILKFSWLSWWTMRGKFEFKHEQISYYFHPDFAAVLSFLAPIYHQSTEQPNDRALSIHRYVYLIEALITPLSNSQSLSDKEKQWISDALVTAKTPSQNSSFLFVSMAMSPRRSVVVDEDNCSHSSGCTVLASPINIARKHGSIDDNSESSAVGCTPP